MLDMSFNNSFPNLFFSFSSFLSIMCLNIWSFSLFMLKSAASSLALINTQLSIF